MTDINIDIRTATGLSRNMLALANPDGTYTLYHAENAAQRAALLGTLNQLSSGAGQEVSNSHLEKMAAFAGDAGVAPLEGPASATTTVGPFSPVLGRPIIITLTGDWDGSVQLVRSIDAGATLLPITIGGTAWGSYTGNVNEPVWSESEAAATFFLKIMLTAGTVDYRLAQ